MKYSKKGEAAIIFLRGHILPEWSDLYQGEPVEACLDAPTRYRQQYWDELTTIHGLEPSGNIELLPDSVRVEFAAADGVTLEGIPRVVAHLNLPVEAFRAARSAVLAATKASIAIDLSMEILATAAEIARGQTSDRVLTFPVAEWIMRIENENEF